MRKKEREEHEGKIDELTNKKSKGGEKRGRDAERKEGMQDIMRMTLSIHMWRICTMCK